MAERRGVPVCGVGRLESVGRPRRLPRATGRRRRCPSPPARSGWRSGANSNPLAVHRGVTPAHTAGGHRTRPPVFVVIRLRVPVPEPSAWRPSTGAPSGPRTTRWLPSTSDCRREWPTRRNPPAGRQRPGRTRRPGTVRRGAHAAGRVLDHRQPTVAWLSPPPMYTGFVAGHRVVERSRAIPEAAPHESVDVDADAARSVDTADFGSERASFVGFSRSTAQQHRRNLI